MTSVKACLPYTLLLSSISCAGLQAYSYADTIYWDGSSNDNWRKDANWTDGGVPTSLDAAIFPDGSPQSLNFHGDISGGGAKINGGISTVETSDYLVLTLPVRSGARFSGASEKVATIDGVTYKVQSSTELSYWTEELMEVEPALDSGMPALSSGWEYRSFRSNQSADSAPRSFIRVTVE